jgi:Lamin Tail Domain
MFLSIISVVFAFLANPASTDVVISQIYGGGGNSNAVHRNDFIELFNRGGSTVSIAGWSIQYASASGSNWSKVDLTGTISPGQYYLIQLASGGATGAPLPAPDATATISMAATAGKVVLSRSTTALSGSCPSGANVIDLVGYGSGASCFEGPEPAAAPSTTRSLTRSDNGCRDSDNNQTDFVLVTPAPRNSAAPRAPCQSSGEDPPPPPSPEPPGTVLVFPFYSSSIAAPSLENTRISLTNTSTVKSTIVHLFFVINQGAGTADRFICLSPNQTVSFLTSEIDPGVAGFVIAVVVDPMSGCPIRYDEVIGIAEIKLASQHRASLPALALALVDSALPVCGQVSELRVQGPRVLSGTVLSSDDGFRELIVVTRIGGSLLAGSSSIGELAGLVFNDAEEGFSFSLNASNRQLREEIDTSFPRTTPRVTSIVSSGRSGWFKLWRVSDGAIAGAQLVFNPRQANQAFTGGRNLHQLSSTVATLTLPVFPPTC